MLRHLRSYDIWISENLKIHYLKNKKSFQSEIKFFLVLQVLSSRLTIQTSKNVAGTTFKIYQSNTYRKDLSWLYFDNEPWVQERQQVKD